MENNNLRSEYKKNKRKKSRIKKFLLFLLVPFVLIGGYFSYVAYSALNAADESYKELDRGTKSKLREKEVEISKEPFSVLIMGIENYSSGGKGGRSDTLMVATFNPNDGSMKLLSIPRDSRVDIPGRERKDKINHAYSFGGKDLTISTVEDLFDIPIDYYATVNFEGFVNIVDTLGGITVDVPFDFWDYKGGDWNTKYYFEKGEMHLNGDEALTYARMRKRDPMSDLGRNERQKQVLKAVIDEVFKPSSLLKVDDLTSEVGENVETNFRVSNMISMRKAFPNFSSSNIETLELKGIPEYINNISYFIPEDESIEQISVEFKEHLNQTDTKNQATSQSIQ